MKRILDKQEYASMNVTGANIRAARERMGLTQKELSIKLETMAVYVCRGSISRIESGARIVTDIELKAIAEVLRVPVQSLFEENAID